MIGVGAISGGMAAAALFIVLVLLFLAGAIAGIVLIRTRPKAGWLLALASVALLGALAAWTYSALHVTHDSMDVQLGTPWDGKASACADSVGEKMCFPPNAHYTTKVTLPNGSARTFDGEQLFFRVDRNGRIFAVQAELTPEPTAGALSTLLAFELREGSASYRGCGGVRDATATAAFQYWLAAQKAGDCNLEVRHAGYLVGFDLHKSARGGDSIFVWYRIELEAPKDRAAYN